MLLAIAMATSPTLAQPAKGAPAPEAAVPPETQQARALYAEGIELVKLSQMGEALAKFEKSAALRPHPVTTYNIGACERALGRYTRARVSFAQALEAGANGDLSPSLTTEAKGYLAEIERLLVAVRIDLDPADAGVAVDGRPLVQKGDEDGRPRLVAGLEAPGPGRPAAGAFVLIMDPGTRVLTLSRKGFTDVVVTRAFAPGAKLSLPLALTRLPGTIKVDANEASAIVTVNGADVGMAPVDVSRPAGSYRVVVRKDGFETYEAQVALNAGEETSLSAKLIEKKTPVTKKWWFWTSASAALVGGVTLTYLLTRPSPQPPPYDGGSTGWVVPNK